MDRSRILFLDYMRVLAFVIVVLAHKFYFTITNLIEGLSNDSLSSLLALAWNNFIYGGGAGVVIFFIVSGYIICHVLKSERPIEFCIKRIFRIYPLYIAAVLTEILLSHSNGIPFPHFTVIIQRLLLVGDFFNTPLSLGGVEWTLRVEMLFYIFMAIIKSFNLLSNGIFFSIVALSASFLMMISGPLPESIDFHHGYVGIFSPFLFIGSLLYLVERGEISKGVGYSGVFLLISIHLISVKAFSPAWVSVNYGLVGMALFAIAWRFRDNAAAGVVIIILSDLTYSVYLLHNWIWAYILKITTPLTPGWMDADLLVIPPLLVICYVSHKAIELPFVRLGKSVSIKITKGRG